MTVSPQCVDVKHSDDGMPLKGKFAEWFEKIYKEYTSKPDYIGLIDCPANIR